MKVRGRGEGSLLAREEEDGARIFSESLPLPSTPSPLVTGYDFANFPRVWKISIALWKIKTSALLFPSLPVSLSNLDLEILKNSLLNEESEARGFLGKEEFFFFFFLPRFFSSLFSFRESSIPADNYRGIKSRIVGPTGRGSLHKYEDDVLESGDMKMQWRLHEGETRYRYGYRREERGNR